MRAHPDQEPRGQMSVAEVIAEKLAERIVTGALRPDAPVRQDRIADEFNASHVPVREAFRKLEAQGLLVSEPRRGVRVASIDPLAVTEVVEMRAALEVLALRHAFSNLGPDDLESAEKAIAEGEASSEVRVWESANRRFHRAIVSPCGMPRLLRTIDDLHIASARYLFLTWKGLDWRPRSDAEHRRILDGLRSGNLRAATGELRRHIVEAGGALVKALPR